MLQNWKSWELGGYVGVGKVRPLTKTVHGAKCLNNKRLLDIIGFWCPRQKRLIKFLCL